MGNKGAKKRVATKRPATEDMQDSLLSAQRETEHEADMQMEESSTGKQQRTDGEEEGVGESSDSESLLSSVAREKPRSKKKDSPKTADSPHINIDQKTEEHLVEWFKANALFYNKCDKDFKDKAKKARLMEAKAKDFGLTGILIYC